jgi:cell wall-associated NlpC family hydrolase
MKRISALYLLCVLAFFSSCKSLKNTSATGNSSAQKKQSNNNVFLDNVSVTPGGERSSTLNTSTNKPLYTATKPAKNFDIESVQAVQIKYATMLDVPIEDISNVALFQDIDYWWGTKYCMGGSTQNCIDCSAFTQTIIKDIYSIQLPRTAEDQFNIVTPVEYTDLQEGDLVFFQTTGRTISHVGVYLANNKFVHASTSGGVMISDLNEDYWKKRFRAAGRVRK